MSNDNTTPDYLMKFAAGLENVLGINLRKPMLASLGKRLEDGSTLVFVPEDEADEQGMVYFHNFGDETGQTWAAQAFMEIGTLTAKQTRYGMPIRVRIDPITKRWVVIEPDPYYGPKYLAGVEETRPLVELQDIVPGLLTTTMPTSMKARVLGGPYSSGDDWKFFQTKQTIDFTTAKNAVAVGQMQFALVQIEFATGTLGYLYGTTTVPNTLTVEQAYLDVDQGTGTVFPDPTTGYFRCGYIGLFKSMTKIERRNIWAVHEILSKGGGSGAGISDIVTICGEVLVSNGDVVING